MSISVYVLAREKEKQIEELRKNSFKINDRSVDNSWRQEL